MLNSFLQFMEQDESESLLLAATNHVSLLDRALFRRFDDIIEFSLPTEDLLVELMQARLAAMKTSRVDWRAAAQAASGLSQAEAASACSDAAKDAVLRDQDEISADSLLEAIARRRDGRRRNFAP